MNAQQTKQIRTALDSANGKRRERLADLADVIRVIVNVAKGPDGAGLRRICGTVPNSYSYRASATVVTAVRVGDTVRVQIREGNAAKVAGGGSGYTESAKNQDVAALLAHDPAAPEPALAPWQTGAHAPKRPAVLTIPLASAKRQPLAA